LRVSSCPRKTFVNSGISATLWAVWTGEDVANAFEVAGQNFESAQAIFPITAMEPIFAIFLPLSQTKNSSLGWALTRLKSKSPQNGSGIVDLPNWQKWLYGFPPIVAAN
jgi:hypothetical protein